MKSKLLEQRKQAEELCLSSIKDRQDAMRALAVGLSPSHFAVHAPLFSALLEESQRNDSVDTVWTGLMQSVQLGKIDVGVSVAGLMAIEGACPYSAHLLRHAKTVKDLSAKAQALSLLGHAQEAIEQDSAGDRDTIAGELDKVRSGFSSLAEDGSTEDGDPTKFIDECVERIRNPDSSPRLKWWKDAVSRDFLDVEQHELVVIAGRPACGKTVLACNQVLHTAITSSIEAKKKGLKPRPAVFINAEMSGASLMDRMALSLGDSDAVGGGMPAISRRLACLDELRRLRGHLLVYDNAASRKIAWIEAKINLLCSIGQRPSCLCIDYLQLLNPPPGTEKAVRERQVAELSRRLKLIAKDYNVPVFLLCQLNREAEKEERAPRMSDLRESGSIEQDADRILFLYRDDPNQQSRIILLQEKHRAGPCKIANVMSLKGACYQLSPA